MPICGFCKKEVVFEEEQPNSVKITKFRTTVQRFKSFICPHCDSVLSIAGPY